MTQSFLPDASSRIANWLSIIFSALFKKALCGAVGTQCMKCNTFLFAHNSTKCIFIFHAGCECHTFSTSMNSHFTQCPDRFHLYRSGFCPDNTFYAWSFSPFSRSHKMVCKSLYNFKQAHTYLFTTRSLELRIKQTHEVHERIAT